MSQTSEQGASEEPSITIQKYSAKALWRLEMTLKFSTRRNKVLLFVSIGIYKSTDGPSKLVSYCTIIKIMSKKSPSTEQKLYEESQAFDTYQVGNTLTATISYCFDR